MYATSITTVMIFAAALLLLHPAACHTTNSTADTEFIRTSCAHTQYPQLCFATLSRHSAAVRRNPARLAGVAVAVSLAVNRRAYVYVDIISRRAVHGEDPRAAHAAAQCSLLLDLAVDDVRDSLRQMKTLGRGGESEWSQLEDVGTWMSAAMTEEETCTDGFEDVADGPVKAEVCNRIDDVKKITSNALALVVAYMDKFTPPPPPPPS